MKSFGQRTQRPEQVTHSVTFVVVFGSWLAGDDDCGVGKDLIEGGGSVDVGSASIQTGFRRSRETTSLFLLTSSVKCLALRCRTLNVCCTVCLF